MTMNIILMITIKMRMIIPILIVSYSNNLLENKLMKSNCIIL